MVRDLPLKLARGGIPLYYQIAQILRSQIHSQEYKPDDLLPTEEELVRSFGVSRTTVRQALHVMLAEGLIHRIAGKGTFVNADIQARRADWSVQSIEGLINAGHATQRKLLGTRTIVASAGVARILKIAPGGKVTQLRKLELVDSEPFLHATLHIPSDLAARIPMERVKMDPVFTLIEAYCRLRIQEARQWTTASLASSTIARHLGVNPSDPVLLQERHFIDVTGRVVEIATDHYRTDRMRHYVRLTRADALRTVAHPLFANPSETPIPLQVE